MKRGLLIRLRDDRGVSAVMTLALFLVLIGFVGLATDGGLLWRGRISISNAADSAALAAAETYALHQAQCGVGDATAQTQATQAAQANQPGANPDPAGAGAGYSVDCGAQRVTVQYVFGQKTFFTPLFGVGSPVNVKAKSTAAWGAPQGLGGVVPFILSGATISDCGIPPANDQPPPSPIVCHFWYNNKTAATASGSQWAQINLATWNISRTDNNCPSAGTSTTTGWINNGYPSNLSTNYPNPTFVCLDTGGSGGGNPQSFPTLGTKAGQSFLFPVNCAQAPCPDPYGQVDLQGVSCPPSAPNGCNVAKYDIIGFAWLQVVSVHSGKSNDTGWQECGSPAPGPDSNAWCLTAQFTNYTVQPGEPGPGPDFGVQSVALEG
jgi:Flp pilus assembly protein TadG